MQTSKEHLEDYVVRFSEIEQQRSPFRPIDMALERYDRIRYAIIGRPGEVVRGKKTSENVPFSITMLKVEPGKGAASHAHDTPEVFVIITGRWEIAGEHEVCHLEPFDVISVPPGMYHSLKNVGTDTAWILAVNAGQTGAPLRWSKDLIQELREMGTQASEFEYPPGSRPAK